MHKTLIAMLVVAGLVAGCNTMQGACKDIERGGEKMQGTAKDVQKKMYGGRRKSTTSRAQIGMGEAAVDKLSQHGRSSPGGVIPSRRDVYFTI